MRASARASNRRPAAEPEDEDHTSDRHHGTRTADLDVGLRRAEPGDLQTVGVRDLLPGGRRVQVVAQAFDRGGAEARRARAVRRLGLDLDDRAAGRRRCSSAHASSSTKARRLGVLGDRSRLGRRFRDADELLGGQARATRDRRLDDAVDHQAGEQVGADARESEPFGATSTTCELGVSTRMPRRRDADLVAAALEVAAGTRSCRGPPCPRAGRAAATTTTARRRRQRSRRIVTVSIFSRLTRGQ